MKRRHLNILALGLMVAAVGGVAAQWGAPQRVPSPGAQIPGFVPLPSPPDPEVVKAMAGLEQEMMLWTQVRPSERSPRPLTLFGHRGEVDLRGKSAGAVAGLPPAFDDRVSFAFSGGSRRFCVVGGRFLTEGNSLSDGSRILRIESKRVLMQKRDLSAWVPVDAPVRQETEEERNTGRKR